MEGLPGHAGHPDSTSAVIQPNPSPWECLGTRCPRQEVVFFAQTFLVYIVVIAAIVNLSCTDTNTNLWVALLASSIGIMLPSPRVKNPFKRLLAGDVSLAAYRTDVGTPL